MVHGRDDIVIPYKETSLRLLELLPNSELACFFKMWSLDSNREKR